MKLEPKQLQQELKQGLAWPVYWIFGEESYRVREVCNLLKRTVVGDRTWCEETLDGASVDAGAIVASAQSIPLGGGARVLWVRDAHLVLQGGDTEDLAELFAPRAPLAELGWTVIFVAKDLDGRRKFSKQLLEKAAVVACEAVPEDQREAWVRHMAGLRGIQVDRLPQGVFPMELLLRNEPWSLDWVDNEITKWELSEQAESGTGKEVLLGGTGGGPGSGDAFISAFLERRSLQGALPHIDALASKPEISLPLLGLLSWNVRMLGLLAARSRAVRIPPMVENKLRRALSLWRPEEIQELQAALFELDFAVKQTPQEPVALWGVLVHQFCR